MSSSLISGIRAFQEREFPKLQHHYKRLAAGESPKALFITCSDSRIDPYRLTQSLAGDLFVVRNLGNVVPDKAQDSDCVLTAIEYAVQSLRIPEIVVCGHSHCNGIHDPSTTASPPTAQSWITPSNRTTEFPTETPDALWELALVNVRRQLSRLRTLQCVADAMANNRLTLSGWCYQIETGDVYVIDEESGSAARIDGR